MNPAQTSAFESEIALAKSLIGQGDIDNGFTHLERAHVIGQAEVRPHVLTHWLMFKVELRRGRLFAAWGQAVRVILGAIGSAVGVVPIGNTGGSDISMFKRMPIPADIQALMREQGPDK